MSSSSSSSDMTKNHHHGVLSLCWGPVVVTSLPSRWSAILENVANWCATMGSRGVAVCGVFGG